VNARDVTLYQLTYNLAEGKGDAKAYDALAKEMAKRSQADALFHDVFNAPIPDKNKKVKSDEHLVYAPKNYECLRFLVDTHEVFCGDMDEYSLGKVKYLVNACETKSTAQVNQLAIDLEQACNHKNHYHY